MIDALGYLVSVEANLQHPLSPQALHAFDNGSGSELKDSQYRPAKMKALHSSAALTVNVFDYWTTRNTMPLEAALSLEDEIKSIAFEVQFPTGLKGTPPNLDLALKLSSGSTVAIESKFSEWLNRKPSNKVSFSSNYFPLTGSIWKSRGLPACQSLAADIYNGLEQFYYLDAPQLLKHALGLRTQLSYNYSLYYIYFDWISTESKQHKTEIEHFINRVGAELRFRALPYQELFHRLSMVVGEKDTDYIAYLGSRYFTLGTTK